MSTEKTKLTISKSQFMKGLNCPLSLWFFKAAKGGNRAEASSSRPPLPNSMQIDGDEVGTLAHKRFPEGVKLTPPYHWTHKAARETLDLLESGQGTIFEATAVNPADGTFCSIDVLRRVPGTDEYDLIEVKSSTKIEDRYISDIAFQRHVFTGAGYKIRNCYLMNVDSAYVRGAEVDVEKFFVLNDVTAAVEKRQTAIQPDIARLIGITKDAPQPARTCTPGRCDTPHKCWPDLPLYSIFNACAAKDARSILDRTGSLRIEDIPPEKFPVQPGRRAELEAHLTKTVHADIPALGAFLREIRYPVYYLDYETVAARVPIYQGTRTDQQVPFQFSLHIQRVPGGSLTHVSFLHKERTDPRSAFAKALIDACGDRGSVIVYYKDFEAGRNDELARDLPEFAGALRAINARMVDLLEPFKNRWLYSPAQNGSASIKAVLPAFTPLSYNGLAIKNGEQAFLEYRAFVRGQKTDPEAVEGLWRGLEAYCTLDTYAMVALIQRIREIAAAGRAPAFSPPAPRS